MRTWLAAIGLFSMLGQVVLLRELNVAFYGSELIYILALGVWMLLSAAGAAAAHWRPTRGRLRALLLASSLSTALALALARVLRPVLGDVPGAYLSFPLQAAAMVAMLAPIAPLCGLGFQWAARLYARSGRTVAAAYGIESAGGLAGGALATLLFWAGVPNLTLGLGAALATALAALPPWRERPRWLAATFLPSAALLAGALVASPALDRRLTALSHPHLIESRDTPYGRITVTGAGGQVTWFENDAIAFDSHATSAEELADVAAVQRPAVGRVAVLGGAVEGLARAVLAHNPVQVDAVELDRTRVDLARAHLPAATTAALDGVIIGDPRAHLRAPGEPYDLILIGAPEPSSGLTNRYFTREMFAAAAARLSPSGVLAFRLPASGNLLGPHHRRRLVSIHRAVSAELGHVVVLPGGAHLFLASAAPLERDASVLAARLDNRGLGARLVSGPYLRYLYQNDRFAAIAAAVRNTDVRANRDSHPVCYQHTLLIWLSKFYPAVALLELDPRRVPVGFWLGCALAFVAALALARLRPGARAGTRVAIAGFAGMVLETVVILAYQSSRGALFGDLGLLLTAFMAGLTAASAVVARLAAPPRWLGTVLSLGLVACAGAVAGATGAGIGLWGAGALLFATGAAVAGVFTHATSEARDREAAVAPLYAADLAGGALASVLASLVFIPWLGLWGASLLAGLVALGALVEQ